MNNTRVDKINKTGRWRQTCVIIGPIVKPNTRNKDYFSRLKSTNVKHFSKKINYFYHYHIIINRGCFDVFGMQRVNDKCDNYHLIDKGVKCMEIFCGFTWPTYYEACFRYLPSVQQSQRTCKLQVRLAIYECEEAIIESVPRASTTFSWFTYSESCWLSQERLLIHNFSMNKC